jgi:1,4-dihydroxy-2-naphthoyl-CoA synthase
MYASPFTSVPFFGAALIMGGVMTKPSITDDAKEGVNAFLKKRRPRWKER